MRLAARLRRLMEAFRILDRSSRMVSFRFNEAQEAVWREWQQALDRSGRLWTIVLKARKVGISTLIQNLLFAYGFWVGNGESNTLAHDGDSSHTIFEMQRRIYMNFPLMENREPPRHEIRIATPEGYVVHRVSTAGAEAKGRGSSPFGLHASEAAFWKYPETMLAIRNAMPLPHLPSLFVEESTANGKSGRGRLFYEDWKMAGEPGSHMVRIFLPFFLLSEYRLEGFPVETLDEDERLLRDVYHLDSAQLSYFRFLLHNQCHGDPMLRRQEFPWDPEVAFVSSGLPALPPGDLARQRVNLRPPDGRYRILTGGKLLPDAAGELCLWRHPDGRWPGRGRRYVCGVDSAPGGVFEGTPDHGDTRSWTAAEILDVDTGAQVGEWYGPLVGRLFAPTLHVLVTTVFPEALCAIELNSEGGRTLQSDLREQFGYHRLHPWRGKRDRVKWTGPTVYGWETNPYTRPMILDNAVALLARDGVTLRSDQLLEQLGDLTKSDTGRYEAEVGRDDLALAWMIACESWQENFHGKRLPWERKPEGLRRTLEGMGLHVQAAADGALDAHLRKVMGRAFVEKM